MQEAMQISAARGQELQTKSKEGVQFIERDGSAVMNQLRPAFVGFADEAMHYLSVRCAQIDAAQPAPSEQERAAYYRTVFNMTTEKVVREFLVERAMVPALSALLSRESDPILVAAMANLVFEDDTKKLVVESFQGVERFSAFMASTVNTVRVHAARAIFSITTVYEYKLRFGTQEGLLALLVENLRLDNEGMAMNAAGALANIAIHPQCKIPIVNCGGLERLQILADRCDSDLVLHQVSRCLFSLAAEKSNRARMCSMGFLPTISRVMGVSGNNPDILSNAIGCFGNLAMSESAAQNSNLAERIVGVFIRSQDGSVDRQAARVIFSFCFKENVKPKLCTEECVGVLLRKLRHFGLPGGTVRDMNIVRDLAGTFASTVHNRPALKNLAFREKADEMLFEVWTKFEKHEDATCNVLRSLLSLSGTDEEKLKVFSSVKRTERVCEAASMEHGAPMRKLALGTLGSLAQAKCMREILLGAGAVEAAVRGLFGEPSIEARKQAAKVVVGLTGSALGSFWEDIAQFGGGAAAEAHRLRRNMLNWVEEVRQTEEIAGLSCFKRSDVKCLDGEETVYAYEALVGARFPGVFSTTEIPSVPRASWKCFISEIHSIGVQDEDSLAMESMRVQDGVVVLAKTFGVIAQDGDRKSLHKVLQESWKPAVELMLKEKRGVDVTFRAKSEGHAPSFFPSCKLSSIVQEDIKAWISTEPQQAAPPAAKRPRLSRGVVYASCHKEILSARSGYFQNLFHMPWGGEVDVIDFDYSPAVLAVFMRYVYFGWSVDTETDLHEQPELAWNTMMAAQKYGLQGLQHHCEFVVAGILMKKPASAVRAVAFAESHHLPCLWLLVYSRSKGSENLGKYKAALKRHPEARSAFQRAALELPDQAEVAGPVPMQLEDAANDAPLL